jgi:hypothetical protein
LEPPLGLAAPCALFEVSLSKGIEELYILTDADWLIRQIFNPRRDGIADAFEQ